MSWRLVLGLILAAVIVIRYMLLGQKQKLAEEQAEQQKQPAARRFAYPAGWPDERIQVPAGSSAVATSMIDKLLGSPGKLLSVDLGGVKFRGVGFRSDATIGAVARDFADRAMAAGYRARRSPDELTVGIESEDGRVCFYLSLDTDSGPFTLWSTER
jgi:hypothetical protein